MARKAGRRFPRVSNFIAILSILKEVLYWAIFPLSFALFELYVLFMCINCCVAAFFVLNCIIFNYPIYGKAYFFCFIIVILLFSFRFRSFTVVCKQIYRIKKRENDIISETNSKNQISHHTHPLFEIKWNIQLNNPKSKGSLPLTYTNAILTWKLFKKIAICVSIKFSRIILSSYLSE